MSEDILNNSVESQNGRSRRSILRAGVGVGSVALLPGVAGAAKGKPTNEERAATARKQAGKIREKTGSRKRMLQFLKKKADHIKTVPHEFGLAKKNNNGPSTNQWYDRTFSNSLTMTYYTDCASTSYANIFYDISMDTSTGLGSPGPDQITLSWDDDHFRYNSDTADFSSSMDNLSVFDEEFNGVDFQFKDGAACSYGCGDKDFWVSCDAEFLSTNQERAVEAEYHDMYSETKVTGFSVDQSGSVSFNFSTLEKWDEHARKVKEGGDAYNGCL
ncbi:hypothetical protein [Halorussus aquaticus]|uniref:Uncharacterized protein n=1 Tax=Halorussus aquaticus TaxID=2953748 RepID=A0ABD5Q2K0_9EURY|nr:hypothetical protein [Halorussus aquaticus]